MAATLAASRSSLYYRKRPRGSRADRTYDVQIVVACGEKPAYGYRRVAWWLTAEGKPASESKTPIAGDARTWVAGALAASARTTEERVGTCGSLGAEANLAIGHDNIWAGAAVGWAYLVSVIDCCTREIVDWNLSHRCRTEDALIAVEQSMLERLPEGSRSANLTLTTDNGTQFTSSRFLEALARLGITHRRTAYHISVIGWDAGKAIYPHATPIFRVADFLAMFAAPAPGARQVTLPKH